MRDLVLTPNQLITIDGADFIVGEHITIVVQDPADAITPDETAPTDPAPTDEAPPVDPPVGVVPDAITDINIKLTDKGDTSVYVVTWKHAGEGDAFEFGGSNALKPNPQPLAGPVRGGEGNDEYTAEFSVADYNPGEEFCIRTKAGTASTGEPLLAGDWNGVSIV